MFKVNDIIYSWTKSGGCGNSHEFAIITKITKTGRFAIRLFANEYISDDANNKEDMYGKKCRIKPNFNIKLHNSLIREDGSSIKPFRKFEKYSDDLELYEYADFGW